MEATAAPVLTCRVRACRRNRRCLGIADPLGFHCTRRIRPQVAKWMVSAVNLWQRLLTAIAEDRRLDAAEVVDPDTLAMAVAIARASLPVRCWPRIARALPSREDTVPSRRSAPPLNRRQPAHVITGSHIAEGTAGQR